MTHNSKKLTALALENTVNEIIDAHTAEKRLDAIKMFFAICAHNDICQADAAQHLANLNWSLARMNTITART